MKKVTILVQKLANYGYFKFAPKRWSSVLFPDLADFLYKNSFWLFYELLYFIALFLLFYQLLYVKTCIYKRKPVKSGNKTLDQRIGANKQKVFFAKICYFFAFFQLFITKNTGIEDLIKRLGCTAPKCWSKYTTPNISGDVFDQNWRNNWIHQEVSQIFLRSTSFRGCL